MPKPVLGRGLGQLLNTGQARDAAANEPNPPVPHPPGGVETLLRGKTNPPDPQSTFPPSPASTPAPSRTLLSASLLVADACLVVAGAMIALENSFAAKPVRFCIGLTLVGLGAWFGCLAWRHARK